MDLIKLYTPFPRIQHVQRNDTYNLREFTGSGHDNSILSKAEVLDPEILMPDPLAT